MISAVLGLATLTAQTLFTGRRAWAALFLAILPPILLGLVAAGGEESSGEAIFRRVAFDYSLRFMIYLLALIFGIAISSGEIEEGTAGYLYLGALPRWAVTLVQTGVASAALSALSFISLLTMALMASLTSHGPLEAPWRIGAAAGLIAAIGIHVTMAFTVFCGLAFRRPLVVSLIAVFFWEIVVTYLPVRMAASTVTNNLRALMLPLVLEGERGRLFRYVRNYDFPTYGDAAMFLSVLTGIFLVAAMVASMNRSIEGKEARE